MALDTGQQANLGITGATLPSQLMDLLVADEIIPGASPSYQLCKTIYSYHPLGAKMAEAPIVLAQSQDREIRIPGAPEDDLKKQFNRVWEELNADIVIRNAMRTSRIYGIASATMNASRNGEKLDSKEPIPYDQLHELDISFNILDPLNTAGSLVLNQDPNAVDFQKPKYINVAGQDYHPSRSVIVFNEQPVYIDWTNSAFGFVGRSVYQRALYPLKSYIQSMIMDNSILEKAGLIVAKMKSPGSIIDQRARSFFGMKRDSIKGAKTGNVVSIGIDEALESLNLTNLKDAAKFSRDNILINIATSANMPASMINQETLAEGFGEGTEDAKEKARYIDSVRLEMDVLYKWMDKIVMHRAWNPTFYSAIQRKYKGQFDNVPYETAFYAWKNKFEAVWPNLLAEPDSEKAKTEDVIMKAALGVAEVMIPVADPDNRATIMAWLADVVNDRKLLFSAPLELDLEALSAYTPPEPEKEPHPQVESSRL